VRQSLVGPLSPVLVNHVERLLIEEGSVVRGREGVALAGHDPLAGLSHSQRSQLDAIEQSLRQGGRTAVPGRSLRRSRTAIPSSMSRSRSSCWSPRAARARDHAIRRQNSSCFMSMRWATPDVTFEGLSVSGAVPDGRGARGAEDDSEEHRPATRASRRAGDNRRATAIFAHLAQDAGPGSVGRDDVRLNHP